MNNDQPLLVRINQYKSFFFGSYQKYNQENICTFIGYQSSKSTYSAEMKNLVGYLSFKNSAILIHPKPPLYWDYNFTKITETNMKSISLYIIYIYAIEMFV